MEPKYKLPEPVDVYDMHKSLFSDKAIQDIERRRQTQMLFQYNLQLDKIGIKAWDPYPDNGLPTRWGPECEVTRKLYRTFCKMGIYMHYNYQRRIAPVKCFGLKVKNTVELLEGINILAEYISNIADNSDCIIGSLMPLAYLPLAKNEFTNDVGGYAVFSYIAIDSQASYKQYNNIDLEFQEGGVPITLEEINAIRKK